MLVNDFNWMKLVISHKPGGNLYLRSFCAHTRGQQEGEGTEEVPWVVQAASTTGKALAKRFLETQQGYGLEIDRMRAQGYDGAANMAGIHRGIQAIVRYREMGAFWEERNQTIRRQLFKERISLSTG